MRTFIGIAIVIGVIGGVLFMLKQFGVFDKKATGTATDATSPVGEPSTEEKTEA